MDQLKNQRSTRLVEMVHPLQSSEEAAQLVLERSSKRRAVGDCLQAIGVARCSLEGGLIPKETAKHLRPLMDSPRDMKLFFKLAERLAREEVPDVIIQTIRMGRMTALRKAGSGVRGIVAGDIVRRLVARTMAQPSGPSVEAVASPFQYALSTRAGGECVAHVCDHTALTNARLGVSEKYSCLSPQRPRNSWATHLSRN